MSLTVGASSITGASIIQILTLSNFDNFDTPIVGAKVPNKYDEKLFMYICKYYPLNLEFHEITCDLKLYNFYIKNISFKHLSVIIFHLFNKFKNTINCYLYIKFINLLHIKHSLAKLLRWKFNLTNIVGFNGWTPPSAEMDLSF